MPQMSVWMIVASIIAVLVFLLIGFVLGVMYRKKVSEREIASAEDEAKRIINEGIKAAESKKREALLEAKEEIHRSPHRVRARSKGAPQRTFRSRSAVSSRRKKISTARPKRSKRRTETLNRQAPGSRRPAGGDQAHQEEPARHAREDLRLLRGGGQAVSASTSVEADVHARNGRHEGQGS